MSGVSTELLRASVVSGLLLEQRIPTRNVIRAVDRTVTSHGLDVVMPGQQPYVPPNLVQYKWQRRAYVDLNGKRARLIANPGDPRWRGHHTDISGHYERNVAAGELFSQSSTRRDTGDPTYGEVYGDALLFTDVRAHWWINPDFIDNETIVAEVRESLTTKNMVAGRRGGEQAVLFLERPSEDDLVTLKLRFS